MRDVVGFSRPARRVPGRLGSRGAHRGPQLCRSSVLLFVRRPAGNSRDPLARLRWAAMGRCARRGSSTATTILVDDTRTGRAASEDRPGKSISRPRRTRGVGFSCPFPPLAPAWSFSNLPRWTRPGRTGRDRKGTTRPGIRKFPRGNLYLQCSRLSEPFTPKKLAKRKPETKQSGGFDQPAAQFIVTLGMVSTACRGSGLETQWNRVVPGFGRSHPPGGTRPSRPVPRHTSARQVRPPVAPLQNDPSAWAPR